jgi:hypothetical protein
MFFRPRLKAGSDDDERCDAGRAFQASAQRKYNMDKTSLEALADGFRK